MKARIIFVLIVFGLSLGLTTTKAKADPSWPVTVIRTDNVQITDWLAHDLTTQTWIYGSTLEVYNHRSGNMIITSFGRMNYDLWEYAPLEQLCTPDLYGSLCHGTEVLIVPRGMFTCMNRFGDITTDAQFVATKSGQWSLFCHFKEVFH
jgi:hypothetical protein